MVKSQNLLSTRTFSHNLKPLVTFTDFCILLFTTLYGYVYSYFIRDSIILFFLLAGLSHIVMSKICIIRRKVLDSKQNLDYPDDLVSKNYL